MTATLTPVELVTREIGFFEEKRKSIEASIKASEARLKDIRSEFDAAALVAKRDLDRLHIEQEQKKAALREEVQPLQNQVDALRYQVAAAQQKLSALDEEHARVLDDRRKQLEALDAVIHGKQHVLNSLTISIASFKEKIGAL